MKRFTLLSTIILIIFVMFSTPALAGSVHVKDNNVLLGKNNTGIQGNKNHHNTVIGGDQVNNKGTIVGGNLTTITIDEGDVDNSIENKNTNKNINYNKQDQEQEQNQKQGQIQGQQQEQTAHNEGVSNTTSVVFNEAKTKREHIGGSTSYANVIPYNGEYKYGAEFLSIDTITAIKKNFSFEAAWEDYGKKYGEGKCKTIGHSYNGRHEDNPSENIDVYTLEGAEVGLKGKKFEVIGFLTVKAVKEGIDSFMVMQKAVLSAGLMQGDAFVVTSEGASIKPKSSGWGIGTFFSGGQVADHSNRGDATAGGGGTGYSKTTVELITLPWITVQVLKYID